MSIVLLKVYNVGTYYGQPYFMNIYLFDFFFKNMEAAKKGLYIPIYVGYFVHKVVAVACVPINLVFAQ